MLSPLLPVLEPMPVKEIVYHVLRGVLTAILTVVICFGLVVLS